MKNLKSIRRKIQAANIIVFKLGTNVLSENGDLAKERLKGLIKDIASLKEAGKKVIIVTSGAIGLGVNSLGIKEAPSLNMRQACAAIGQSKLMSVYASMFKEYKLKTAQLLLTEDDFSNRKSYLHLQVTMHTLLDLGVIPIVNQNDAVSSTEIKGIKNCNTVACFGDNDKLSSLVMSKLEGDLLVILTDVEGLYDSNPKKNEDAKLIKIVNEIDFDIEKLGFSASTGGRGGMKTKIEAVKIATKAGGIAVIANGKKRGVIKRVYHFADVGTFFLPKHILSGKKRWIAYASNINAKIIVNDGAKRALTQTAASLLPIGAERIEGDFIRNDVVSICNKKGEEFAKGVVNYNSSDARKLVGQQSTKIEEILGYKNNNSLISTDNIAVL